MEKIYRFGKFTLDTGKQTFYSDGSVVHLPTKAFEILLMLVENNGEIVTKDEMLRAVWQDTFVEESNLAQYVSRLRKILNRDGQEFIKTFSKRGYRFSADLAVSETGTARRRVRLTLGETPPAAPKKLGEIKNLAILPFRSLGRGGNEDDSFLELGIADALITQLTRARQLIVRPTTAVLRYRDSSKNLREIAAELEVDAVLQGSLQTSGKRLRLTVQMYEGESETPIWAEVFSAEITDVFAVQDEIAVKIVASLNRDFSADTRAALEMRYKEDSEAYQEYLKGRFYLMKRSPDNLKRALVHFERAIEIAPLYAPAYSGIGDVYKVLPLLDEMPPDAAFPRAKASLLRALEIDPELVEAHASLGVCLLNYDHNWQGAEVSFRKAIELDPNFAAGRQVYATFLLRRERIAEAIVELQRAKSLDPLSPVINTWLAEALTYLGEYEAAIVLHRETIRFSPDFFLAYYHLTFAYLLSGQPAQAIETSKKALALSANISLTQFACVFLQTVLGEHQTGREILNELLEKRARSYISAVNIASCFAALGDTGEALSWLETGLRERDPNITWLKIDKEFALLRKEPRFTDILRQINL